MRPLGGRTLLFGATVAPTAMGEHLRLVVATNPHICCLVCVCGLRSAHVKSHLRLVYLVGSLSEKLAWRRWSLLPQALAKQSIVSIGPLRWGNTQQKVKATPTMLSTWASDWTNQVSTLHATSAHRSSFVLVSGLPVHLIISVSCRFLCSSLARPRHARLMRPATIQMWLWLRAS